MRGEAIRMLLTHAGIPYTDNVIEFGSWKEVKLSMPNKQIPAIEFKDGDKVGQSHAILRFLGLKYGYYPEDPR